MNLDALKSWFGDDEVAPEEENADATEQPNPYFAAPVNPYGPQAMNPPAQQPPAEEDEPEPERKNLLSRLFGRKKSATVDSSKRQPAGRGQARAATQPTPGMRGPNPQPRPNPAMSRPGMAPHPYMGGSGRPTAAPPRGQMYAEGPYGMPPTPRRPVGGMAPNGMYMQPRRQMPAEAWGTGMGPWPHTNSRPRPAYPQAIRRFQGLPPYARPPMQQRAGYAPIPARHPRRPPSPWL